MHEALQDYGAWVQYSVFECDLNRVQFLYLRHRLRELLRPEEGESVRFYHLCDTCRARIDRIGGDAPPEKTNMVVV